jgi:hypothetical protein
LGFRPGDTWLEIGQTERGGETKSREEKEGQDIEGER